MVLFSDPLYRIWQWSQSEVTEHLNLISHVSQDAVLYFQVCPVCYWRCVLVCGLSLDSQQELIHRVVKSVAESLKQASYPLTRDPSLSSFSVRLSRSAKNPCAVCLKERYERVVWCCGGGKLLCTCGWNIWWFLWRYDECAMCCVCEISKFERWVWVTVDLIRLMGFCQSISVDFNKCVCEWVNKARSHSRRLSHLWAREVRWVGARLRLVTVRGPPSSSVVRLHGIPIWVIWQPSARSNLDKPIVGLFLPCWLG